MPERPPPEKGATTKAIQELREKKEQNIHQALDGLLESHKQESIQKKVQPQVHIVGKGDKPVVQALPLARNGLTLNYALGPDNRKITILNNIPMYCSTGQNSKNPNTWFPFQGFTEFHPVQEQQRLGLFNFDEQTPGAFLKPHFGEIQPPIFKESIIRDFINNNNIYVNMIEKNSVFHRFGSMPGLLYSSLMGGGYWDDQEGKQLLTILKKEYATFYENNPIINLADSPEHDFKYAIEERTKNNYSALDNMEGGAARQKLLEVSPEYQKMHRYNQILHASSKPIPEKLNNSHMHPNNDNFGIKPPKSLEIKHDIGNAVAGAYAEQGKKVMLVNAANPNGLGQGTLSGDIFQAAMPDLHKGRSTKDKALRTTQLKSKFRHEGLAGEIRGIQTVGGDVIPTGEARITNAYGLNEVGIDKIAHAVAPKLDEKKVKAGQEPTPGQIEQLYDAYLNTFLMGKEAGVEQINTCILGGQAYHWPPELAAGVAAKAMQNFQAQHPDGPDIKFIFFDDKTKNQFLPHMEDLPNNIKAVAAMEQIDELEGKNFNHMKSLEQGKVEKSFNMNPVDHTKTNVSQYLPEKPQEPDHEHRGKRERIKDAAKRAASKLTHYHEEAPASTQGKTTPQDLAQSIIQKSEKVLNASMSTNRVFTPAGFSLRQDNNMNMYRVNKRELVSNIINVSKALESKIQNNQITAEDIKGFQEYLVVKYKQNDEVNKEFGSSRHQGPFIDLMNQIRDDTNKLAEHYGADSMPDFISNFAQDNAQNLAEQKADDKQHSDVEKAQRKKTL